MKRIVALSHILLLTLFLFGCSKRQLMPGMETQISGKDKPNWTFDPTSKDTKNLKVFVGVSHYFQMEGYARADALKDARQQIIDYMVVVGKRSIT